MSYITVCYNKHKFACGLQIQILEFLWPDQMPTMAIVPFVRQYYMKVIRGCSMTRLFFFFRTQDFIVAVVFA